MTLPDNDPLIDFLCRHRPDAPPPSPELENQILAAISTPRQGPLSRQSMGNTWRRPWAIPGLVAAAFLAWGGWVTWQPSSLPNAELAAVDDFLTATWYDGAYGDTTYRLMLDTTEPDWLLSVYATPY